MADFKWTVGFINAGGKFLSAEKFQHKVSASGNSLRKKQTWTLEKIDDQVVAIKSCFDHYLGCDKNGVITGNDAEIGDDNKFELVSEMDGKVAIKSSKHNRFVAGNFDDMRGTDAKEFWTLQLAMSPQINLRNVNRKTYAHLGDDGNEIHVNEQIPWGYDATITLGFTDGKYSIRAANAKYLSRTGQLVGEVSADTLFTLVFRGGEVAFRDCQGKYLTCLGPKAVMQSRKNTISKDELFTLEDTNPQVSLNSSNGKYASIRLEEVRANQMEVTDSEIFQLEAVDRTDFSGNVKWAIRSKNNKYWKPQGPSQVIHNVADSLKDAEAFTIVWQGPKVSFMASNGKYIGITTNGRLAASNADCTDECRFLFEMVNHPIITLRSEFGFVGAKGAAGTLECNRSQYDIFLLECKEGTYNFKTIGGLVWCSEGDNFAVKKGASPLPVDIELRGHTRLCIKAPNGQYIKCAQNGAFTATGGDTVTASALLEY